ncbi:glycoside hydrolase family 68 protein [Natronococcus pandeyae]|nr:glycoside hydrolase family 68 protein [Natronococcus pandeyae]
MNRRTVLKTAGALGVTASVGIPAATESAVAVEGGESAHWTEEHVEEIELTDDNTAPVIDHEPDQISEDRLVWDTWPLRNRDGSMAQFNGWQIIFSLTADPNRPEVDVPGDRHDWARISYFYSRDGKSWQEGGVVLEEDEFLGDQTWAGSAMYDPDEEQIYHFYTAADSFPDVRQRLAVAVGGSIETGPHGVEITGPQEHHIIGEADGEMYQTFEQGDEQGMAHAFRDPWYFQHPETGEDLLVFEGNTPTGATVPGQDSWNGNIGVMRATSDDLTEWELLPPVLEAVGVNQELERPHYIFQNGNWYLFFITHEHTYAPGLQGPEGLHGFVGDSMYDPDMEPLNESSLVIANPEEEPFQAYSWDAMQHGSNMVAQSFLNFRGDIDSLDTIGDRSPEEQREIFGGTLAPSLKVNLDGDETRIVTEKADGYVPPSGGRGGNGR